MQTGVFAAGDQVVGFVKFDVVLLYLVQSTACGHNVAAQTTGANFREYNTLE
jgi:hypothetical protein